MTQVSERIRKPERRERIVGRYQNIRISENQIIRKPERSEERREKDKG